nr:hypothetical protein [uncultured Devosia sp.]
MAKPHLTLVPDTGGKRPRAIASDAKVFARVATVRSPEPQIGLQQLFLPFDEPAPAALSISIVAMDTVHGTVLNSAIVSKRPKTVLDLRYSAIFNQYGSSRETVFGNLAALGAYYSFVSMPWHSMSARDFMAGAEGLVPRVRHELLEREPGSVMFFVPKPEHSNMLATYLNTLLSSRSKVTWVVEQVQ